MNGILTVTLNPALDLAAGVERVIAGQKLRCAVPHIDPGGGGINVSRVVAELDGQSTALVVVGGATGLQIVDLLQSEGIPVLPIPAEGTTRQSLAITETSTSDQFRFVFPGPDWKETAEAALLSMLGDNVEHNTMVVLSGSFPPGAGSDLLGRIGQVVSDRGGGLCLDTSGPVLKSVLDKHCPLRLLRIDRAEAEEIAAQSFQTPVELAEFGRSLLAKGVAKQIVLSLADKGTLGVTADGCTFCAPPKVNVDSAVGAGDSLLAALVLKSAEGWDFSEALRYGTAAAAAAVTTPATSLCLVRDVERLFGEVTVEVI